MSQPMRVYLSDLTGRAYVTTNYTEHRPGHFVAITKKDVTQDVVHDLMAMAWARGWNECNAATEGDAPTNTYRPTTTQPTAALAESRGHHEESADA